MGQRHPGGKQRAKGDGRGSQSWEEALSTGTVQVHLWRKRGVEGTVSATHWFVSTVDMVRILLVIQGVF